MTALIVDDEPSAITDLKNVLISLEPGAGIMSAEVADDAISICREHDFDVVFLDINMPGKDGLALAKEIRTIRPMVNIVFVSAYQQYALDAFRMYASGYILKPAMRDELSEVLANLRYPIKKDTKGLFVRCFGSFEVFYDGETVRFNRSKTKELFAYLIDRRGASATNAELRAVLWGDEAADQEKQRVHFAQITRDLRNKLKELQLEDIYEQNRDSYAIRPDRIPCDYYMALEHDPRSLAVFQGEYMSQYSWGEMRLAGMIEDYVQMNKP